MNRFIEMTRVYYSRPLYTKDSFQFASKSLLLLVFLFFCGLYSEPFEENRDLKLVFGIISVIGCLLFSLLNYIGQYKLDTNARFNWLYVPYITSIFSLLTIWGCFILNIGELFPLPREARNFLIYYPIIFPILLLLFRYVFFEKYKDRSPKKDPLRVVPAYVIGIPAVSLIALFILTDMLQIKGVAFFGYAAGTMLSLCTTAVPFGFTGTSTYWQPTKDKLRYDNALETLKKLQKKQKMRS
ncbi:hypothetical protein [Streptococcus loxodontisalivarius]|uniref:Phosphoglycerol transferase MdoB-like AlkP superfamily enzyme n=1 Tax=Streptococcus loxodontisalivarius TaxID=1349415 RepID=A0ABS2PST8_9STRE|nr:hypothetical protein [Streptococcus loxodontisalivarius]MBM7642775.1 phosphoglycerol transferase MdoB-like AlkP superfamily enzyme [Streptococcus loxodontisalivarius]